MQYSDFMTISMDGVEEHVALASSSDAVARHELSESTGRALLPVH